MQKFYGDKMDLLCRKGYYPYEWVDKDDKLNYEGLPPKESFYSRLKQEGISDEVHSCASLIG